MTALRLSLILPKSSMPMTFTFTTSPMRTTSVTELMKPSDSSETCTRPSWLGSTSTNAPNSLMAVTRPS